MNDPQPPRRLKAGVDLVGRSAGPVRTPLMDGTADERAQVKALTETLGPQ